MEKHRIEKTLVMLGHSNYYNLVYKDKNSVIPVFYTDLKFLKMTKQRLYFNNYFTNEKMIFFKKYIIELFDNEGNTVIY